MISLGFTGIFGLKRDGLRLEVLKQLNFQAYRLKLAQDLLGCGDTGKCGRHGCDFCFITAAQEVSCIFVFSEQYPESEPVVVHSCSSGIFSKEV